MAMVACFGIIIAWFNSFKLPLDTHEAYVVESARQMAIRGDWIVPYFNGEPRLAKPPMGYWLTGIASRVSGAGADMRPWHGRVPSMLAGAACAVVIGLLGSTLYERKTAILAALMFVASNGFFAYSVDARPDMAYALLCFSGFGALVAAYRRHASGKGTAVWTYGAWIAFGVATLTKGPHMPLALLLSFVVFLLLGRASMKSIGELVRPLSGMAVFASIALPWWFLIWLKLGDAPLARSELSGSLYAVSLDRLISLYYLYRPFQLLFPWVVFLPLTVWYVKRFVRIDERCLLLVCTWFVPALVLSFSTHARWFYMLPVLPAAVLLISASVMEYAVLEQRSSSTLFRSLLVALELIILSAAVWLLAHTNNWISQSLSLLVVAFAVVHLCLTGLRITLVSNRFKRIVVLGGCLGVVYLAVAFSKVAWSNDRYERAQLGAFIAEHLDKSVDLLAWGVNPAVLVYYAERTIPSFVSFEDVDIRIEQAGHAGVGIVTGTPYLRQLENRHDVQVLARTRAAEKKDQVVLVLVRRKIYPEPAP